MDMEERSKILEKVRNLDFDGLKESLELCNLTKLSFVEIFKVLCEIPVPTVEWEPEWMLNVLNETQPVGLNIWQQIRVLYQLVDAEFNVNEVDENGKSPLFLAVEARQYHLAAVLLQCGADMFRDDLFELVTSTQEVGDDVMAEVFHFYYPGLWEAVRLERLEDVRRLVNVWCKTELSRDGISLREMAVDTGNESLCRLIPNIVPSMRFAFHLLAGNFLKAKELFDLYRPGSINLDLKNFSCGKATLLSFAILQQDLEAVEYLVARGAAVATKMKINGKEIPHFFLALHPQIDPSVFKTIFSNLPSSGLLSYELLSTVWSTDGSAIHYAAEVGTGTETVEELLKTVGPRLLCERSLNGDTGRDLAVKKSRQNIIDAIDRQVDVWVRDPVNKNKLLLGGYRTFPTSVMEVFGNELFEFEARIQDLLDASINNNPSEFESLVKWPEGDSYVDLGLYCRLPRDCTSFLHHAVLHQREDILRYLTARLCAETQRTCSSLADKIRDKWGRTPLHYAYATRDQRFSNLLLDVGMTEHTLDKDDKEPTDFRDVRGSDEMENLLEYLRNRDYKTSAPDPWNPAAVEEYKQLQRRQRFMQYQQQPKPWFQSCAKTPYRKYSVNNNAQSGPWFCSIL